MLLSAMKHVVIVGLLGAGALLAGCQSTAKTATPMAANAPTTQTASCPRCRVVTETNELAGSHRLPTVEVVRCDACTNAVTNFLTKGEFKHTCSACGDNADQMCAGHSN